jgi:RimJ/RimL family protein N-acetyltransferase
MYGLVFGIDHYVAKWQKDNYGWAEIFLYDQCIGICDDKQNLKGAIFLHGYNGNDIQLSYYGEQTLSVGIARSVARFILEQFDPSRLTVIVSKRNKRLIRSCQRFGFRLEGVQRRYYGKIDSNRNAGVRLVAFRDHIEHVARLAYPLEEVA